MKTRTRHRRRPERLRRGRLARRHRRRATWPPAISEHLAAHADDYAAVVASRDWHDAHSTNGGHFHEPGDGPGLRRRPGRCTASRADPAPTTPPSW